MSTIPSNCSVLNPAATAHKRVTVNSAAGSRFSPISNLGELVVDRPPDVKFVPASIVPSGIPCVLTLERTPVTNNSAVKGLTIVTETWATLFSSPVVGSTKRMIKNCLSKRQRVLTRQRGGREKVTFQAGKRHIQADSLKGLQQRGNFRTPTIASNGDQRI